MKLSSGSKDTVRTLAKLAQILELNDVSTTSYQTAMADIIIDEQALEIRISERKKLLSELKQRRKAVNDLRGRIKSQRNEMDMQSEINEEMLEKWQEDATTLAAKVQEYEARADYFKSSVQPQDVEELSFQNLEKLNTKAEELKAEWTRNKETLDSFKDLPPDVTLAKIHLAEKKQMLAELVDRRQALLENMLR
ncbi:hypothetical protein HDU97_001738 [Phlyctochytrium planicorne]|nr:hypothetical protein HDU97_001738 [Phlyctochytrium planicorne]